MELVAGLPAHDDCVIGALDAVFGSHLIKIGLQEARRKGHKLGRPTGSIASTKELLSKHADIVRKLKEGQSVRSTAKDHSKGDSTVQRVKAALALG